MFRSITLVFTRLTNNYLPDAYIFALILTVISFFAGIIFMGRSPVEMATYWGDGLWNLNNFAMQMALVLILGFTLAKTHVIKMLLDKISSLAKNQNIGVLLITFSACVGCYINWGFGLIISALLTVEFARKLKNINYGLLVAAAYSGFLVWHGGISGSIPLALTNPTKPIANIIGTKPIGLDQTLFSKFNILILIGIILTLLLVNYLMSKFSHHTDEVILDREDFTYNRIKGGVVAQRLENSIILNFIIVTIALIYLIGKIGSSGISLNIMIMIFLVLGLIFHGSSKSFLLAFNDSVKDASGILLQFPFYAGIMAMMAQSGIASSMSEFFIGISTKSTFLFFTYLSAGIVNFFVPSGGGQWALQAPIILPAAKELGVSFSDTAMAIAWGDAWTNMVQPFWALPLLSAARCELKKMMTYSVGIFLCTGVVTSVIILLYSI